MLWVEAQDKFCVAHKKCIIGNLKIPPKKQDFYHSDHHWLKPLGQLTCIAVIAALHPLSNEYEETLNVQLKKRRKYLKYQLQFILSGQNPRLDLGLSRTRQNFSYC